MCIYIYIYTYIHKYIYIYIYLYIYPPTFEMAKTCQMVIHGCLLLLILPTWRNSRKEGAGAEMCPTPPWTSCGQ